MRAGPVAMLSAYPSPVLIVGIGDSRFRSPYCTDGIDDWLTQLVARPDMPVGCSKLNIAIPGTYGFEAGWDAMPPSTPIGQRVALVCTAGNGYTGAGTGLGGTIDCHGVQQTGAQVANAYDVATTALRDGGIPYAQQIVNTEYYLLSDPNLHLKNQNIEGNRLIRLLVQSKGLVLMDLAVTVNYGDVSKYPDHDHPNAAGSAELAQISLPCVLQAAASRGA